MEENNNKSRFLCFGESEPHYFQFITGDVVRLVNELNEFGGIVMADNGKVLINTFSGIGIDCGSYSVILNCYINEVSYKECHKFVFPSNQMVVIDGHPFLASNESIAFDDVKSAVLQVKVNELAEELDEFAQDYDLYEYRDCVDDSISNIQSLRNDIETGNTKEILEFLHGVIEDSKEEEVKHPDEPDEFAERAAKLESELQEVSSYFQKKEEKKEGAVMENNPQNESKKYSELGRKITHELNKGNSLSLEQMVQKQADDVKLREESKQMSRFLGEKLMRPHKKGR
jgi:hypothetical protein